MKQLWSLSLVAILFCACETESIKVTKTESQFKRLIADAQFKSWELQDDGTDDFEICADGFIYTFTKNSTDTSFFYITEQLTDCAGNDLAFRDTLMTLRWSISDTESSLFDDFIYFIQDNDQSEAFRVLDITPESMEIQSQTNERRLRFSPQ